MTETDKTPGVYEAITRVAATISRGGISKNRQAKNQNGGVMYNFRGIDDVFNALSPILAKEKIVIFPRVISREQVERKTNSGSVLFFVTVEVEFDLVYGGDGSRHTVKTYGEAMDSGDKSTNKALSAAYKYMALQVFCIPLVGREDADDDVPEDLEPSGKASTTTVRDEKPTSEELLSVDQVTEITDKIRETGVDATKLLVYYEKHYKRPFSSIAELPVACYQNTLDQIELARKRLAGNKPGSTAGASDNATR